MSRTTSYVKSDDASSSREERLARLKTELREHIRSLSDYDLLAPEWVRMAESLHQIANVAFMETHLPTADENPLHQEGKKAQGTLWDQERDELAVRILLEEGKLNLALRVLHKYKTFAREPNFPDRIEEASRHLKSDVKSVTERCRVFEQSLGMLLKFTLSHIEALQIVDLPECMAHIAEVLSHANNTEPTADAADWDKLQETLVIYYLEAFASKIDDLDEERIMDLIEQHQIIPLFVSMLYKHYKHYSLASLSAASHALSGFFSSEPFQTDVDRFLPTKDVQTQVVAWKGRWVAELVSKHNLKRKEVQSLLDEVTKLEKKVGVAEVVPLTVRGVPAVTPAAAVAKD